LYIAQKTHANQRGRSPYARGDGLLSFLAAERRIRRNFFLSLIHFAESGCLPARGDGLLSFLAAERRIRRNFFLSLIHFAESGCLPTRQNAPNFPRFFSRLFPSRCVYTYRGPYAGAFQVASFKFQVNDFSLQISARKQKRCRLIQFNFITRSEL